MTDGTPSVTGGASGIGRATAIRLASEGAAVVAVDVNAELLSELAGPRPPDLRGSVSALVGDVSTEAGVEELVAESAADRLGTLDVVVNVAGVLSFSHTHEQSLDEWNRLVAVNLTGTFLVCRQALPYLLSSRGNIVNLASTAAHNGPALGLGLRRHQGRGARLHPGPGRRVRGRRPPGQQHQPGRHRHPDHRRLPSARGRGHQAPETG